ncbi:MAG: AsnC family transcriptional regulator [Betaproteobacteria bacterium]|nr:AsnC family transcriptional regulator [Betaproteobacteria bacterium]
MDELDRAIVNGLHGGFPVCERPFAEAAASLGTDEATLIERINRLLEGGVLTRFGPLFDAEALGGAFTLCALAVPGAEVERVAAIVNGFPEVAHHYERAHRYNLWFVLATETRGAIPATIARIEAATGYPVLDLPRLDEYFVELKLPA